MTEDLDRDKMQKILDVLDYSTGLSEQRAEHQRQMSVLLLSLLEVMDSFDRLFAEDADAAAQGVVGTCQLIARQLAAVLERVGVRAMQCMQTVVNPQVHEVVGTRPAAALQDGIVLEVVRSGYERHGKVLRPAQVIIGRLREEDSG